MGRPSFSFVMQRAISGLWVAWKPLTAPQAIVMNRQGKMGCPSRPTEGPRFCRPCQNSGREGHLMRRHTIRATAMNSRAAANTG